MELIIDADILMSALISTNGRTFDLIFNDRVRLYAPEFLLEEVEEHRAEILEKSGLDKSQFDLFLSIISSKIDFIPKDDFEEFRDKSSLTTPDPDDAEYLALAMKRRCAIWSNDKKLKQQIAIKIYSTEDLINLFEDIAK